MAKAKAEVTQHDLLLIAIGAVAKAADRIDKLADNCSAFSGLSQRDIKYFGDRIHFMLSELTAIANFDPADRKDVAK